MDKRNLREALRACIGEYDEGAFRAVQIAQLVMKKYPALIAEASTRLMLAALTDMVRRMLKAPIPAPAQVGQLVLALPNEISHLQIPLAFSVLPEDVEIRDGEQVNDNLCLWVPFSRGTPKIARRHAQLQRRKAEQNQRQAENAEAFADYVNAIVTEDELFAPALQRIVEQEQIDGRQAGPAEPSDFADLNQEEWDDLEVEEAEVSPGTS
jgi:hypothetical protein